MDQSPSKRSSVHGDLGQHPVPRPPSARKPITERPWLWHQPRARGRDCDCDCDCIRSLAITASNAAPSFNTALRADSGPLDRRPSSKSVSLIAACTAPSPLQLTTELKSICHNATWPPHNRRRSGRRTRSVPGQRSSRRGSSARPPLLPSSSLHGSHYSF